MVQSPIVPWCIAAFALMPMVGCWESAGEHHLDVEGTVRYRGDVVKGGMILFQPHVGQAITSTIDPEGRFRMAAPAGTYQVAVVSSAGIPDDVDPWKLNVKLPPPQVPSRFGRPETSGTSVEVAPDKTTLTIALQ